MEKVEFVDGTAYISLQMSSDFQKFLPPLVALTVIIATAFLVIPPQPAPETTAPQGVEQAASVGAVDPSPAHVDVAKPVTPPAPEPVPLQEISASSTASLTESTSASVVRIQNPYPFPPKSLLLVNEAARAALVNIFCSAVGGGALWPISGSGVIIDPRGIILTNAHVAQFVLLAQSRQTNLSCIIRSGAPARALWAAEVLYISPPWIEEHAADITNENPLGTGEQDFALLRITGSLENIPVVPPLGAIPHLPFDTRDTIGFPGDYVLAASYPAELTGSTNLHPVSSITPIQELLTFESATTDLLGLGGVIEAQGGSSGGAIVNEWGYLIGIITTTSEGETTAERELRALTLSYIDRAFARETGYSLSTLLDGNIEEFAEDFARQHIPALTKTLLDQLPRRQ